MDWNHPRVSAAAAAARAPHGLGVRQKSSKQPGGGSEGGKGGETGVPAGFNDGGQVCPDEHHPVDYPVHFCVPGTV